LRSTFSYSLRFIGSLTVLIDLAQPWEGYAGGRGRRVIIAHFSLLVCGDFQPRTPLVPFSSQSPWKLFQTLK
jgi:hypothetical protein